MFISILLGLVIIFSFSSAIIIGLLGFLVYIWSTIFSTHRD